MSLRHFLADDDLTPAEQTAVLDLADALKAEPYKITPVRRAAPRRGALRQADPANPDVLRGRHRRARRLPDDRRRPAGRHREARVGGRHRPGSRPAGGGDRLADLRPERSRGDGRVRRRAGDQRADRRLPSVPDPGRPADHPGTQGPSRRSHAGLRRRRRQQHGQLLPDRRRAGRAARPDRRPAGLPSGPAHRRAGHRAGRGIRRQRVDHRLGRRGRGGRRRAGHRHLDLDGSGERRRPTAGDLPALQPRRRVAGPGGRRRHRAALPARVPGQGDRRRGDRRPAVGGLGRGRESPARAEGDPGLPRLRRSGERLS